MYNLAAPRPSPRSHAASLTRPAIVTSTRSCSPHACSQHPSQNRFLAEPLVRKPIHAGGRRRCDLGQRGVAAAAPRHLVCVCRPAPDHGRRFQPSYDGAVGGGELVLVPEPREQRAVGKRDVDEAAAAAGVDEENAASVMPAGDTQDEEEPAGDTQDEDEEEGVEPAGVDEEEEAAAGDTQDDEEPAREDENEEEPAGDTQDVDEAAGIDEEEAAGVEQAGDTQDEESRREWTRNRW
ncbi:hypothetical protein A0H81_14682 [Grifola frondosa]|uniref:Uncharacterized protein n=1 Tax=Grifola frondosa TaxID=5627 RepID=A0A1C7LRC8_GRIFR|nr:hypothetical protein A0H81_14682 [Grifola frondosa]